MSLAQIIVHPHSPIVPLKPYRDAREQDVLASQEDIAKALAERNAERERILENFSGAARDRMVRHFADSDAADRRIEIATVAEAVSQAMFGAHYDRLARIQTSVLLAEVERLIGRLENVR